MDKASRTGEVVRLVGPVELVELVRLVHLMQPLGLLSYWGYWGYWVAASCPRGWNRRSAASRS